METFIFDTSAIVAFLNDEIGADKVEALLHEADNKTIIALMHHASVAEVCYNALYKGQSHAEQVLLTLLAYPIQFIETITLDLIKAIGYYKTKYRVSFADTFVLATAKLNNGKIITSDHHEFDEIERNGDAEFEWIR